MSYLDSEAFVFIKSPFHFKSIQAYDLNWMFKGSLFADNDGGIKKVQVNVFYDILD